MNRAEQILAEATVALGEAADALSDLTTTRTHGGDIGQLVQAVGVARDLARRTTVDDTDLRERTALIAVDVQHDFLPGGALGVTDGDKVVAPLVAAAKGADLVIASGDRHPTDHLSFTAQGGPWPTHCVIGTHGAEIHPEISTRADFIVAKGTHREAYSAFDGGTDLAGLLREKGITRVLIGGLALDYCVKATALDAAAYGFDTTVLANATRAVAFDTGAEAIKALREAGVHIRQEEA